MAALARRYRLPRLEFHPLVAGYEVDFRFVGSVVIVECDGHQHHGIDRNQFEFDRIRTAVLAAAGFVVVQVTWAQVTATPKAVADRLRAVLERWAPHLLAPTAPDLGGSRPGDRDGSPPESRRR